MTTDFDCEGEIKALRKEFAFEQEQSIKTAAKVQKLDHEIATMRAGFVSALRPVMGALNDNQKELTNVKGALDNSQKELTSMKRSLENSQKDLTTVKKQIGKLFTIAKGQPKK